MKRYLLFLLLLSSLFASEGLKSRDIADHYPSCRYVFAEFDVPNEYLYDRAFVSFVLGHQKAMKRFYRHALKQGEWLVSMLRGELMEEGMSDLFLYLSIVESGLSIDAVSSKKAVGLWQFMPTTAKRYKLSICAQKDERCDPLSSTRAAIRYLKQLHRRFGKWYLAVMAYNCGEGRLSQAIESAGTDELSILSDKKAHYLSQETITYIQKILLVAMIGESEIIDLDSEDLFAAGKYLEEDRPFQPKASMEPTYVVSHTVVLGDTLERIASEHNSTVEALRRANGLENNMLEVGRILIVPVSRIYFEQLQGSKPLE